MDFKTIRGHISHGQYKSPSEFKAEVLLVFENAMTYNEPQNPVHEMANELRGFFEQLWESRSAECASGGFSR